MVSKIRIVPKASGEKVVRLQINGKGGALYLPGRFLALFTLATSVCASRPVVHLFAQNVAPSELTAASKALLDSGFKIQRNDISPPEFLSRTLIYSPFLDNPKWVKKAAAALSQIGMEVTMIPLTSAHHLYSKNNMGLYLATSSSPNDVSRDFMRIFFGVCGDQDSTLSLSSNGAFSLEILDRESLSEDRYESGTWQGSLSILELQLEGESSEFSIAEY